MNADRTIRSFRTLRKKAFHSYWEKRILSQTGYLLELLEKEDTKERELVAEAVALLEEEYDKKGVITPEIAQLAEKLMEPLSRRAKEYSVICAAHAHIDMNWMWGMQETVTVTLDTVRTMLTLLREYPEFVFSQSQASVYRIVEEYAPELLGEIKERVKEGRWEVTASTWVENDKNMSGGEAMARHLLYTKKYLARLLDIKEESLNLDFEPDTFGHSYNMPEILKNGGVKYYYHCRGYEGENIYRWRGLSGAEVLVYREPDWYNSEIDSGMCELVPAFCKKAGVKEMLKVYGVGDHGGGPTRRDIERLLDMSTWPLYPALKLGTYREFFRNLEQHRESLPVVDQELNYVFTGCYTSQSRIKKANRIGENRLTEADALESMAMLQDGGYTPSPRSRQAWRRILFNQFHDILPGSGKVETREYAMGEFQKALASAGADASRAMNAVCSKIADTQQVITADTAMGAGAGAGSGYECGLGFTQSERGSGMVRYVTLFNTTQQFKEEAAEITLWDWQGEQDLLQAEDTEGHALPVQIVETGTAYWGHTYMKLLVRAGIPPFGYRVCRISEKEAGSIIIERNREPRLDHITDENICLENDKLRAVFDSQTMECISLVQKSSGRQMLDKQQPACGFQFLTEEVTNVMTSWRVGKTAQAVELNKSCPVIPTGVCLEGLRKWLSYKLPFEQSELHVKVYLDEGSELLCFRIRVVWKEFGDESKGVPQLRFALPCGFEREKYRYTIPFGVIDREALAQDVPATGLGCAVPADGAAGLVLMSDCKYGFRGDAGGLSLNLIRSSYDPDPYPEAGEHMINLAVAVSETEQTALTLLLEQYLHPAIAYSCGGQVKAGAGQQSFLQVEGGVLSAVKSAENGNGFIVRVYNPSTETRTVKICLPGRKVYAYLCGFTEQIKEQMDVKEDATILHSMTAGSVCSFRIVLA